MLNCPPSITPAAKCNDREELTLQFRQALQEYIQATAEPADEVLQGGRGQSGDDASDTTAALILAGERLNQHLESHH